MTPSATSPPETSFASARHELLVKDGHSIVRCPVCGLVFRSTLPGPDELTEIYGSAYFAAADEGLESREGYLDYVADAEVHRANARRRLQRLAAFTPTGSLLDVGCAAGFFVDEAARSGWQARGVDVSEIMIAWGKRHQSADIGVGTLGDAPADRKESCVTMWDYIEHALDPRGDVEQAFARLRPGGVLALSTGDDRLGARPSLARALAPHDPPTPQLLLHAADGDAPAGVGRLRRPVRGPSCVGLPAPLPAHKACLTVERPRC